MIGFAGISRGYSQQFTFNHSQRRVFAMLAKVGFTRHVFLLGLDRNQNKRDKINQEYSMFALLFVIKSMSRIVHNPS